MTSSTLPKQTLRSKMAQKLSCHRPQVKKTPGATTEADLHGIYAKCGISDSTAARSQVSVPSMSSKKKKRKILTAPPLPSWMTCISLTNKMVTSTNGNSTKKSSSITCNNESSYTSSDMSNIGTSSYQNGNRNAFDSSPRKSVDNHTNPTGTSNLYKIGNADVQTPISSCTNLVIQTNATRAIEFNSENNNSSDISASAQELPVSGAFSASPNCLNMPGSTSELPQGTSCDCSPLDVSKLAVRFRIQQQDSVTSSMCKHHDSSHHCCESLDFANSFIESDEAVRQLATVVPLTGTTGVSLINVSAPDVSMSSLELTATVSTASSTAGTTSAVAVAPVNLSITPCHASHCNHRCGVTTVIVPTTSANMNGTCTNRNNDAVALPWAYNSDVELQLLLEQQLLQQHHHHMLARSLSLGWNVMSTLSQERIVHRFAQCDGHRRDGECHSCDRHWGTPHSLISEGTPHFDRHRCLGLTGTAGHWVQLSPTLSSSNVLQQHTVHTQVDYIHCLVPDLLGITNCSFYWGKIDRYKAEALLNNKPEGTFLLRDSAQEEYLFSVSFRRYGKSLHARIEQGNHKFSFDSHDSGVFASDTVCGLIEHYKDPSSCMFFEPMLTNPLCRSFTFPLQHLCRATVCSTSTYDGINKLVIPKILRNYLKEYHYKQLVRVRRLDH